MAPLGLCKNGVLLFKVCMQASPDMYNLQQRDLASCHCWFQWTVPCTVCALLKRCIFLSSTVHLRQVLGPLTMHPQSDDNYGVDGYSLVCLQAAVPILAIATTAGTLYHCMALGTPSQHTFRPSPEQAENAVSLYVFEKVKLDLTLAPVTYEDDSFSCPIRLFKDPTTPSRYICSHNSGVHAVALPFIDHLEVFAHDGRCSCSYSYSLILSPRGEVL